MGFSAELKDAYDKDKDILSKVNNDDLRAFGMIPEFIGRLPIVCTLSSLDEDMYVRILREPKNAIIKQYQKLLRLDDVELSFEDGALRAIARQAMKKETGARALRSIIEKYMLDIMYEIPKDRNIGRVVITEDYINGKGGPRVEIRQLEYKPQPQIEDKSKGQQTKESTGRQQEAHFAEKSDLSGHDRGRFRRGRGIEAEDPAEAAAGRKPPARETDYP